MSQSSTRVEPSGEYIEAQLESTDSEGSMTSSATTSHWNVLWLIAGLTLTVACSLSLHRLTARPRVSPLRGLRQPAPEGDDQEVEELPKYQSPSLFCWSRMELGTYEVDLIKLQLLRGASIFACDNFAVFTSEEVEIGAIGNKTVRTWANDLPKVSMGQNGVAGQTTDSFLNTEIFLLGWDSLLASGILWSFDFVVKVDPDAVMFPDRLRNHIADYVGMPVYFPNCGKWGGKVLLYGSLEVFSKQAMGLYKDRLPECKALPWHGWGEDYFMQQCMDTLGVTAMPDSQQVADDRCIGAPCSDWTKVAFHDFKDPGAWYQCFKMAIDESEDDQPLDMLFKK